MYFPPSSAISKFSLPSHFPLPNSLFLILCQSLLFFLSPLLLVPPLSFPPSFSPTPFPLPPPACLVSHYFRRARNFCVHLRLRFYWQQPRPLPLRRQSLCNCDSLLNFSVIRLGALMMNIFCHVLHQRLTGSLCTCATTRRCSSHALRVALFCTNIVT